MRIAQLESQHYALQILLFIRIKKGSYAEEMIREQFGETTRPTIYRALRYLEARNLIWSQVTESDAGGGLKRMWYLTPMGEEVTSHLEAIEKALGMPKNSKKEGKKS